MSMFEITFNIGCFALAGASIVYLMQVVRNSGRAHRLEPARVKHLIDTAPYERLNTILSK